VLHFINELAFIVLMKTVDSLSIFFYIILLPCQTLIHVMRMGNIRISLRVRLIPIVDFETVMSPVLWIVMW
jgi:hypothetical protein